MAVNQTYTRQKPVTKRRDKAKKNKRKPPSTTAGTLPKKTLRASRFKPNARQNEPVTGESSVRKGLREIGQDPKKSRSAFLQH